MQSIGDIDARRSEPTTGVALGLLVVAALQLLVALQLSLPIPSFRFVSAGPVPTGGTPVTGERLR